MNRPTFETELLRHLRDLPVDPPSPGFAARVLGAHRAPRWQPAFGLALAATLMLAIGAGTWLGLADRGPEIAVGPQVVILVPDQVHPISLMFRSPRALNGVTIELKIPEGVELAGRAGRQELRWTTDLQAGANRLDLPLLVHSGGGGVVLANFTHGTDRKQFAVRVEVRELVET